METGLCTNGFSYRILMDFRTDIEILSFFFIPKKSICISKYPLSSLLQVIEGYENACRKAQEILPDCVCSSAKNLHDINEATALIRTAVASKQYGNEDFLANLIAQACGE